ncbi:MAG: translation initiation factor IF-2 [Candidatus Niyogibacteria bacterium]|nr:MAG: translation initiation factor IF-2 [Candidatus Niyogibacteria bacterium]
MKEADKQNQKLAERNPIVVIMGHIDHGKTTLLDHIRKTNVAEHESGGITQHIGAYEATVSTNEGETRKITFIDTPGHEAFSKMRSRGAKVADLAILVIAADDGIKPQTLEALEAINSADIPFVIALNKMDKPEVNAEKTKKDLAENNVLIEEWGGKIPLVPISAKTGEGISDLLEVALIASDLEDLKADPLAKASGLVIESRLDPKRGNAATLIILDGVLRQGEFVISGTSFAPVRIFEDFAGHSIKEASFGQPVRVVGFNSAPEVGLKFITVDSKKEAEALAGENQKNSKSKASAAAPEENKKISEISIIIKADTSGSAEAVENEIKKLESEKLKIKILRSRVGPVTEDDINLASGSSNSIVVGFRVKAEKTASEIAERTGVALKTFEIVYEITEWLKEEIKNKLPEEIVEKELGRAKILRIFKQNAKDQIAGGRVTSGFVAVNKRFRIKRRANYLGEGRVQGLEQNKIRAVQIEEGKEFGMRVLSKIALAEGDEIEVIEEEKIKPEI